MKVEIGLLDAIHDRNRIALEASGTPNIGIFYFINGKLFWEGETPRLVTPQDGIKTYHRIHMSWFYQTLVAYDADTTLKDLVSRLDRGRVTNRRAWKYWPRGRVVCSEDNSEWIVYCDKHITTNRSWQNRVKSDMNLPYDTQFETDGAHYKCYECLPTEFMG